MPSAWILSLSCAVQRKRNEADKNEDEMDDGYETDHHDEGNKDNGHEDNEDNNCPKRLALPRQGTAGTGQKKVSRDTDMP